MKRKIVLLSLGLAFLFLNLAAAPSVGAAGLPAEDAGWGPRALVRVHVAGKADMEKLRALPDLDIAAGRRGEWVDLVISPDRVNALQDLGLKVEVRIADIQADRARQMGVQVAGYGNYFTYSESMAEMDALHAAYPAITSGKIAIGTTGEGRTIWAFKVSNNPAYEDPNKQKVLFNGVTHAREPIGANLSIELVRHLCQSYGVDSHVTELVNATEVWIVPVVNPDGYVYNEGAGGGGWRKNRRHNSDGTYGVDVNRNYGFEWGHDNAGSSPTPGADDYRGTAAFSEPESQAMRDFFNAHGFLFSVDYHSYGNDLLYPYGYENIYTPDQSLFVDLTTYWAAQNGYAPGTPWELLYPVNGGSIDWEYGEQTTKPICFAISPEVGESFWQDTQVSAQVAENLPGMMHLIELAAGGVLQGHVRDAAGSPISGATITVSPAVSTTGVNAATDPAGRYLTILAAGTYDVTASHPDYLPQTVPGVVMGPGLAPVDFTLQALPAADPIWCDNLEGGSGAWTHAAGSGTDDWALVTTQSHSSTHSWFSADVGSASDKRLWNTSAVAIPTDAGTAFLSFWHSYGFESAYDGSVIEISSDGGATWSDLGDRILTNGYTSTLGSGSGNPLGGRRAWSGASGGFVETKVDVTSYLGQTVQARFRLGTDSNTAGTGWWIDDVCFSKRGGSGPTCYALTLGHTGTGSDPVASPASSSGCPAGEYVAGQLVQLTATPGSGWKVKSWTGTNNDASTSKTNNLTMPAAAHSAAVIYAQGCGSVTAAYPDGSWREVSSFSHLIAVLGIAFALRARSGARRSSARRTL